MMRVQAESTVEGPRNPSSALPFHRAICRLRPDLKAIVHAHLLALGAVQTLGEREPALNLFNQRHNLLRVICADGPQQP